MDKSTAKLIHCMLDKFSPANSAFVIGNGDENKKSDAFVVDFFRKNNIY